MQTNLITQNFMLTDLIMFLVAFFGLSLQVLAPGYIIGWFSNLLDFRQRRFSTRLLIGLVFSVATLPVLSYWAGKTISLTFVAWCSLGAEIVFAWIIIKERHRVRRIEDRWLVILVILILLWIKSLPAAHFRPGTGH